ncbi:MAG: aminopeptidase, partial [Magnetococcales bacterium]|nr:aminopeptidase [Magnetococcales bacterium]
WVPAFLALLEEQGGELDWFYQEAEALAALPAGERYRRLAGLTDCGQP